MRAHTVAGPGDGLIRLLATLSFKALGSNHRSVVYFWRHTQAPWLEHVVCGVH